MNIKKEEFIEIVKNSKSKSEICKKLGLSNGGSTFKKINNLATEFGYDMGKFKTIKNVIRKYELIIKICPICENDFETQKGHKSEKITCSNSCANTYFRSGKDNPNFKDFDEYDGENLRSSHFSKKYRKLCFEHHEHKCCVCGEDKLLDVHHFDENKKNNEPSNLIPICATHHNYLHSKYKYMVIDKVINYHNEFIKNCQIVTNS